MEQLGLHATLKNLDSYIFTKVPFEKNRKDDFVCFESCERHEAIQEFLETEIDFEQLVLNGVIDSHFPLH